jgi:hypothetical protein
MGDRSCVGVAGFEVTVTTRAGRSESEPLLGEGPVRDPLGCALPSPFTIENLDPGENVTVTVTGYDGTGVTALVRATTSLPNLEGGAVHLRLAAVPPTAPLLIIHRAAHLEGRPLTTVKSMAVATQMMSSDLLSVHFEEAGKYLYVEPGAYAIPALQPGGGSADMPLTITFNPEARTSKVRLTAAWNSAGLYYEAK